MIKIKMNLGVKLSVIISSVVIIALMLTGYLSYLSKKEQIIRYLRAGLEIMADTGAIMIDGNMHEEAWKKRTAESEEFKKIKQILKQIWEKNKKKGFEIDNIYTLRRVNDQTEFVIMIGSPFIGHKYQLKREMMPVFERGESSSTGIYTDENGTWLSAYSPIINSEGKTVALLEVDYRAAVPLKEIRNSAYTLLIQTMIGIIFSIISGIIAAHFFARPIKRLSIASDKIASGDLTISANETRKDEIGYLAGSFNTMIKKIHGITAEITEEAKNLGHLSKNVSLSSLKTQGISEEIFHDTFGLKSSIEKQNSSIESISNAIVEIANNINRVYTSISEQKQNVTQSSAAIEELFANIRSVTEISEKANQIANSLQIVAKEGNNSVHSVLESMNEVSRSSSKVIEIVNVIQNIAEQTNLLAMNAAIEAAHAGNAGRGFAVVAGEIRKLAVNSSKSAAEITSIINDIINKIRSTNELGAESEKGLNRIIEDISLTTQINHEIFSAMTQQSEGTQEILEAIELLVSRSNTVEQSMLDVKKKINEIENIAVSLKTISEEIEILKEKQIQTSEKLNSASQDGTKVSSEMTSVSEHMEKLISIFKIK